MATTFDEQRRRANSFGDAAAVAQNPNVTLTGLGQPTGIPAPLPIISAGMATPANPPPLPVQAAPVVAPAAPANGLGGGAVFGVYPKPSSQFSTNTNDAALRQGVQATGPGTFVPAVQPIAPNRFNNLTDPRSTQFAGAPAAAAGAAALPAAAAPPPPVPGAVAPAVANLPGAEGTQPTNASEGAMSPVAATAGGVTRVGNSFSGTNVGTPAPVAAAGALGGTEDTLARLGRLEASNAAVPVGGLSVIGNPGPDAAQAMFDGAALRTAAAQGTYSPRKGFQGNDDAVRAAAIPVANRARMGEAQLNSQTQLATTAAREAGDTARLGVSTRANAAVAGASGARDQQRLNMERDLNTLRGTGLGLDNATKQRIEVVQQEVANAKTPEARRAAGEKLAALTGKTTQDQYAALELGGGSIVDASGVTVPQPKSAILYNRATGTYQQVGGAPAAAAAAKPAEGSMSTSNGKPIVFKGGKWVAA